MDKKDTNEIKGISLIKTKSPIHLLTLKANKNFCGKLIKKNIISAAAGELDYPGEQSSLVYDFSRIPNFESEAFNTIIDLLTQLRAAGNDQNVFIQNNTVVREQIVNQLKNEILRVSHKLTSSQIKNLEVISSNSFDEKTLTDILKSLLESSKKKLIGSEPDDTDFHIKKTSRFITLDKISKNYLNVLNRSLYYEKITDKVLKSISFEKVAAQAEHIKLKPGGTLSEPESKVYLKQKSLKELLDKKFRIDVSETLEEIRKSHEETIINKMGLTSRVIKLHSRTAQVNILTKAGTFVEDVIKNSAPGIFRTETELINKIADTSKIDTLHENIILNQQQYEEDRIFQKRNISRVYNEVKRLYSTKNLSRDVTEVLRLTHTRGLNIEENVKKNLLKLTSRKDILKRLKNIYDHTAENVSLRRITEKTDLINRYFEKNVNAEEKRAVREIVNLKQSGTFVDKKFIEDIRENNILIKNARIRRRNYERIHKGAKKLSVNFYENENLRSAVSEFSFINLKKTSIDDVKDYFVKQKNIFSEQIKRNILINRHDKIAENIENTIKKEIISVKAKEIHEKLRFISDKQEISVLKRSRAKPMLTGAVSEFRFVNLKKTSVDDVKDYFVKQKNIFSEQIKRNILINRHDKIAENIENTIKKEIISVKAKEIHEKLRFISDKQELNILKRSRIKPLVNPESAAGKKVTVWGKEDIYKFVPVHIKERISDENKIENVFSKNIIKILSPNVIKSKSLKLHEKNIYRDFTQSQINKYIEKSYGFKKEYLTHERVSRDKESYYSHLSKNYMIYKEAEAYKKEEKQPKKSKEESAPKEEPDIIIKEKKRSLPSDVIDTKEIEKSIMSKTLNKRDVMQLIDSYMKDINIETISRNVIGKVEKKLIMDRRRSGIF